MIPGEIKVAKGDIEINKGRAKVTLEVTNTGDRPDPGRLALPLLRDQRRAALRRAKARTAFASNIAAGTAVRFEPGQSRTVELVALAGDRKVYGFQGKVVGKLK
jgi:urease subunit beta